MLILIIKSSVSRIEGERIILDLTKKIKEGKKKTTPRVKDNSETKRKDRAGERSPSAGKVAYHNKSTGLRKLPGSQG